MQIYKKDKFPGREELTRELTQHETTVNQVAMITKDEQGVTANLVCWSCNTSHEGKCKKPPVLCSKCHKLGHLPTYCEQFTAWKSRQDRERGDEAFRASSEKTAATRSRRPTGGRKPTTKGGQYAPKKRIQAHLVSEDLEVDDEALYEQYDEASVYEEGEENTIAYTVSIEERQQQPADNMVVQAMPVDIQQTKFRLDTGCVGGNVVKDEALLRDVDATNVSVTGVAGPADQTSLKGTLPAAGTSYVLEKARDNLIAVKNLTKQGLTFEGDNSKMVFRDGSGAIVLTARDYRILSTGYSPPDTHCLEKADTRSVCLCLSLCGVSFGDELFVALF